MSDAPALDRALSPIGVGPLRAPSRVLMAPMDVALDGERGMGPRTVAYLAARAATGLAWVTTGQVAVCQEGLSTPHQVRIDDDRYVEDFRTLADAIHGAGGRLVVQLGHAGRQTLSATTGMDPVAPSALPCPVMRQRPRALRADELPGLVQTYADAARRAAEAGADGVELHMGHGYLLNQFLSPESNHRDDAYGGDIARRCRLPADVIAAVRSAVGEGVAVIARFSADEWTEGGIDRAEALRIAPRLAAAGADALHVSACTYGSMVWNIPVYLLPDATFRPLARAVRGVVDVPVIAVGRLHTAALIEDVIASGDADLVAVGRPLIADPRFFARLRAGEPPRPCLRCNRCINALAYGPAQCSVNSGLGREGEPAATDTPRRVLVVGGGAAGMHAATLAAGRGHAVRLVERRATLGGQLDIAAVGPHKGAIAALGRYLEAELAASTADVRLGTPLDGAALDAFDPDVVVLATGSAPAALDLPGDAAFPVGPVDDAMRDLDALDGTVAVIGAGAGGVEAALALADRGLRVVLLEKRPRIGVGMVPHVRFHLQRMLDEAGVEVVTKIRALRAEGEALVAVLRDGERSYEPVAAAVIATGRQSTPPDPGIYAGSRATVLLAGDARQPGSILEAMETARRAVDAIG